MVRKSQRRALLVGFLLVASACSSSTADTTTTSSTLPPTSTTTATSSTTTTAAPIPNGPALAFEGDRNETVEAIQFLMNCNGYGPLDVDGVFGPATRSEVEALQADLGREVTGAPDEETLAVLSRSCSEARRVTVDEAGEAVVVGNVADGDAEALVVRAEEGQRLAVVVSSQSGNAVVGVRSAAGGILGLAATTAWAEEIPESQDYIVEITTPGDAVTFSAAISLGILEMEEVAAAPADSVVLDGVEEAVTRVCLDTTGSSSFIAETGPGFLVVTTGTAGEYAVERGGIGAPIEFVFKDGSPGYHGFEMDATVEVGDRVSGTANVFLAGPGKAAEPFGLAFDFERTASPCDASVGTPIVLTATGLGVVDFGADVDTVISTVRAALPGAAPTVDTGWVAIDNLSNEYGICRQGTTEVRVVDIDNLRLLFTDAGTSFAVEGTRHFAAYAAAEGIFPLVTTGGVGPGNTLGEFVAAHPDAVVAPGMQGGTDVFISSPPGDDRWLRATSDDGTPDDGGAVVDRVTGGRFCDL